MTTSARITANRKNARWSTCPRTPDGKRAAASNALRHGLNVSILPDAPEVVAVAEELSVDLDLRCTTPAIIDAARAIIQYRRIQSAYAALYRRLAVPTVMLPISDKPKVSHRADDPFGLLTASANLEALYREPEGASPISFVELTRELNRLDRYERRAFSARKKSLQRLYLGSQGQRSDCRSGPV